MAVRGIVGDLGPAGNVTSVNGKTGVVVLDAEDVGAQPISIVNPGISTNLSYTFSTTDYGIKEEIHLTDGPSTSGCGFNYEGTHFRAYFQDDNDHFSNIIVSENQAEYKVILQCKDDTNISQFVVSSFGGHNTITANVPITGVDPVNPQHLATKAYVDTSSGGCQPLTIPNIETGYNYKFTPTTGTITETINTTTSPTSAGSGYTYSKNSIALFCEPSNVNIRCSTTAVNDGITPTIRNRARNINGVSNIVTDVIGSATNANAQHIMRATYDTTIASISVNANLTGASIIANVPISGAAPIISSHLTTKSYVDSAITTGTSGFITKVNGKSPIGGEVDLSATDVGATFKIVPTPTLSTDATPKSYVDNAVNPIATAVSGPSGGTTNIVASTSAILFTNTSTLSTYELAFNTAIPDGKRIDVYSGEFGIDTLTLTTTLSWDFPISTMALFPNQKVSFYVDATNSTIVTAHTNPDRILNGSTSLVAGTGVLTANTVMVGVNPTDPNHLATKAYVDSASSSLNGNVVVTPVAGNSIIILASSNIRNIILDNATNTGPTFTINLNGTFQSGDIVSVFCGNGNVHITIANDAGSTYGPGGNGNNLAAGQSARIIFDSSSGGKWYLTV